MKSYRIALTTVVSLLFITTIPSVIAGGSCRSKSCKNASRAAQYQKYADNYDAQAKKAKSKGQNQLATALEKCAAAKRKIAHGFESGNRSTLNAGYSAYKQARKELSSAKTATYGSCSKKKSSCSSDKKKPKSYCSSKSKKTKSCDSYASKASASQKAAMKYESLANSATDDGNVLKAALLRQCAAATHTISRGYSSSDKRLISKGMYNLRMAKSELKKLEKTSSEDAKVFASDNTDLPDTKL